MPVIIEAKFPPEAYLAQYKMLGPCLKVGAELWSIEGKKLTVGIIQDIVKGKGIYIQRVDGTVFRTPAASIMMGEPEKIMTAALKRAQAAIVRKPIPKIRLIDFHKNITITERQVIRDWSRKDYLQIRKYLAMTKEEVAAFNRTYPSFAKATKEKADLLLKMFTKYKDGMASKPLYRGVGNINARLYNQMKAYKPGQIIDIDKAMSSWTHSARVANQFIHTQGNSVQFVLKKGRRWTQELDIEKYCATTTEKEVLLNSKTFRVIRVDEVFVGRYKKVIKVYIEEIPAVAKAVPKPLVVGKPVTGLFKGGPNSMGKMFVDKPASQLKVLKTFFGPNWAEIDVSEMAKMFSAKGVSVGDFKLVLTPRGVVIEGKFMSHGREVGNFIRMMEEKGVIKHSEFFFDVVHRGKGMAKSQMRNVLEFYDAVGITKMTANANGLVGKYAWAKYGYDFKDTQTLGWMRDFFRRQAKKLGEYEAMMKEINKFKHSWDFADFTWRGKKLGKEWMLKNDSPSWAAVLDLEGEGGKVLRAYIGTS